MKRGQISRDAILEQGLAMASQDGLGSITYNGLARQMGIQPQSMYRYLSNIADVKAGIVALYIQKLIAFLQEQLGDQTGKAALHQLAVQFIRFTQSGIPFTDMVWGISVYGTHPEVNQVMVQLRAMTRELVRGVTTDSDMVEANTGLLLEFMVGHLGLITARQGNQEDDVIFEMNVTRLLTQFD